MASKSDTLRVSVAGLPEPVVTACAGETTIVSAATQARPN